jgi:hypothetical protein
VSELLVAPCGINCAFCRGHLRRNKPCPGCRVEDSSKPKTRLNCEIKLCAAAQKMEFCFQCGKFPCPLIQQIEKRYSRNYGLSLVANLKDIQKLGIKKFLSNERTRWSCRSCGGAVCLHDRVCTECGKYNRS